MPTRRAFLGWLAAAIPAAAIVRRAHALAIDHLADDQEVIRALGEAVLPSELGTSGTQAAVSRFQKWIAGYREGAELLHGYGTSALEFAGPTPATRWSAQLARLDATSRSKFGKAFAALSVEQRRKIVSEQLDTVKNARIGAVGRAPHVAIALLSHYYASADATDLCYEAKIGRQTCRPLAAATRKPLPLHTERT
jgi:hypothetical protein